MQIRNESYFTIIFTTAKQIFDKLLHTYIHQERRKKVDYEFSFFFIVGDQPNVYKFQQNSRWGKRTRFL